MSSSGFVGKGNYKFINVYKRRPKLIDSLIDYKYIIVQDGHLLNDLSIHFVEQTVSDLYSAFFKEHKSAYLKKKSKLKDTREKWLILAQIEQFRCYSKICHNKPSCKGIKGSFYLGLCKNGNWRKWRILLKAITRNVRVLYLYTEAKLRTCMPNIERQLESSDLYRATELQPCAYKTDNQWVPL